MKVYRVVTERDGETTKKPGGTVTDIERMEYRYAAEDIDIVWEYCRAMVAEIDETIIAIIEEAPAITVLGEGEH